MLRETKKVHIFVKSLQQLTNSIKILNSKTMKKAVMILAASFRKFLGLKNALKFAWTIIRKRAFSFFKKGDGTERVMEGIEIVKIKDGGLVLCLENGKFKQFYLDMIVF